MVLRKFLPRTTTAASSAVSVISTNDTERMPICTPSVSSTSEDIAIPEKNRDLEPSITIHPLDTEDGMLVCIRPPEEPVERIDHVPCDIVLVIDVSGSMSDAAPVPGNPGEVREEYGMSIMDLTKHAANTILETLDQNDRLGIVTFNQDAKVIQELTSMTPRNKKVAALKIKRMRPTGQTNLWGGIQEALALFRGSSQWTSGNVQATMVLTDGQPTMGCPSKGYVPKLRSMGQLPATIHTFGFGYNLRSGLLKSIAEAGGGNYSFIPDAGMLGTTFIHAVANLQSTYANDVFLRLRYPAYLGLEETTGEAVDKQPPVNIGNIGPQATTQLTISLSTLQYGHPRDIYLRYSPNLRHSLPAHQQIAPPVVTATLSYNLPTSHNLPSSYNLPTSFTHHTIARADILTPSTALTPAFIAYHKSRSALIAYLSSLSPLRTDYEHQHPWSLPTDTLSALESFISSFPAAAYPSDPLCNSLFQDLAGNMRTGQIYLALSSEFYFHRWGKHYLPSLASAHARQVCNSFKDAGPLMYSRDSPLFLACRERLDNAFDGLRAPEPTYKFPELKVEDIDMSEYNNNDAGCFARSERVMVIPERGKYGYRSVKIRKLKKGMRVLTPKGPRRVVALLRTKLKKVKLCEVGGGDGAGVLVTPCHPIKLAGEERWVFPVEVKRRDVEFSGSVYSVLLERDGDAEAHAFMLKGGVWGVSLGHGMVRPERDGRNVRAHPFFADYDRVQSGLEKLGVSADGLAKAGGMERDTKTGLVKGFMPKARRGRGATRRAERKSAAASA